jgi:hypothetical protein
MSRVAKLALLTGLMCLAPAAAQAQQIAGPRIGERVWGVGLQLQPGALVDGQASFTQGGIATAALHHILTPSLAFSVEMGLGAQWVSAHTAAPDGQGPAGFSPMWQVGLMGRWLPSAMAEGFSIGLGMHFARPSLSEGAISLLAAELRAGWLLWRSDSVMWLFELGISAPLIAGLGESSLTFEEQGMGQGAAPAQDWTWWRSSLGVQIGW